MTTPYQKGVRVERLLANELREQGWTVIRSAGSKGPADLVAYQPYSVLIIQVKRCRSVSGLKQAIREAIEKFEESRIFTGLAAKFEIWLRFGSDWLALRRGHYVWYCNRKYQDLLGQTEWPITERAV